MRNIIIGDIHGCYYTLINLLSKIEYNKLTDRLIFVGDYIDRGKYSFEVVSYLIDLQNEVGTDKCICLMGNHEDMCLSGDEDLWIYNGGEYTIESFRYYGKPSNYYNWWFENLPLYLVTEKYIVCHAGLPKIKLSDNTKDDMLWDRNWITNMTNFNEKLVIFGHTPSLVYKTQSCYSARNGNICIDTGCVFGNGLSALIDNNYGFNFEYVFEPKSEDD